MVVSHVAMAAGPAAPDAGLMANTASVEPATAAVNPRSVATAIGRSWARLQIPLSVPRWPATACGVLNQAVRGDSAISSGGVAVRGRRCEPQWGAAVRARLCTQTRF